MFAFYETGPTSTLDPARKMNVFHTVGSRFTTNYESKNSYGGVEPQYLKSGLFEVAITDPPPLLLVQIDRRWPDEDL